MTETIPCSKQVPVWIFRESRVPKCTRVLIKAISAELQYLSTSDCCCATGLKLCSQSPSGIRFLWKNQHSLHKRFYSCWIHKLILLSSTWICWNVHWVNWPTSRRQAAGSILGFGIQTCTATWGKDTEQSCLAKQNSSVYQNSVFLNVSAMDGSPN